MRTYPLCEAVIGPDVWMCAPGLIQRQTVNITLLHELQGPCIVAVLGELINKNA